MAAKDNGNLGVLIGAWVTPEMAAAVKAESRRLDVTKSEVIRLALAEWLRRQEQPEPQEMKHTEA